MSNFFKRKDHKVIHVNDLDSLIGKIELIDIREADEYKNGSLETAKNIPMRKLLKDPDHYLDDDTSYYIICQSGRRSSSAAEELTNQGFDIIDVTGGVGSYTGNKRKA